MCYNYIVSMMKRVKIKLQILPNNERKGKKVRKGLGSMAKCEN